MLRRAAALLVLWLVATLSVRADEPVTLRVGGAYAGWGIPDPNSTDSFNRARRAIFEAFTRQHPNIRLERFTALNVQGPAAESGILMAFAGGAAPDIVYVNMRLLRQYVGQGFLQPLDGLLERYPDALDRVQPTIKKELAVGGRYYALPSAQFVQALYYRKDLFRLAGLDPNRPPATWEAFFETAQKLSDPERNQWGFSFEQGVESYFWINFLYAAGGDVTRQGADGSYKAAFNTPAGEQALEFYRRLMKAKWRKNGKPVEGVAIRSSTRKADISAGRCGMWFAYQSDDIANMNQFDLNPSLIGIAAMPRGPGGKSANEINASMWGINASVTDPKRRAACYEFLRYMSSDEATKVRVTAYVENGLGQLVNPAELKRFGYDEYVTAAQKPWMEAQKTLFANGKPEPSGPNMAFIYPILNEPLDQALLYPDRPARQILNEAAAKVDAKLLNYIPPAQKNLYGWIIGTVFGAIVTGVIVAAVRTLVAWSARLRRRGPRGASSLPTSVHVSAWAFMFPAIVSVAVWAYLPLVRGMLMAFQDYRILGGSTWVGLDNFIEAASQETFRKGMANAFVFTAWLLGMGFVLPIVLALMLNEIPRGKVVFRVLYYLPAVTTSIVVAMLFKQFFDPGATGLANSILNVFHVAPQKWLQDPAQAKFAVVLPLVWAGAGPGSIIYLAALQSIPDEMYEAADLDGAGFFTKIGRVTLPTLMPLIIINLVGATIAAFKIMEPVLVQTGGGPDNATYTIGLEVFYNAFMYLKFGYATAAAWMMGAILIGLTVYQLRILQGVRFSAGNR